MSAKWAETLYFTVLFITLGHTTLLSSAGGTASQVILAKDNGLSLLNLSSAVEENLISAGSILYSADFFVRRDGLMQLFWSDIKHETIQSALLINSSLRNLTLLELKDTWEIENVAVDWLAGNLYWVVNSRGRIDVAKTDGSMHCTVVTNIAKPRALALDPSEGLMFWSDWSEVSPRIERSTLAGGDRRTIFKVEDKKTSGWLNAIALDRAKKVIYWVDAKSHSLHTATYDGGNHRVLLVDENFLSKPFSLDLIRGKLIWPEFKMKAVIEADLNSTPLTPKVIYEPTEVFGVKILSSLQSQPIWEEECTLAAGGKCSHLCLRHKIGVDRCVCPFGMTLYKDGRTCVAQRTVLALVSQSEKKGKVIYFKDPKEPMHAIDSIILNKNSIVKSISYSHSQKLLVWLDGYESKIYFRGPKNIGNFDVPLDTSSIAIAPHSHAEYIYIATGGKYPSIAECSLTTHVCVPIVLENVYSPKSLVFVDKNLIWMDSLNGKEFIEKFSLKNLKRETVYTGVNICCVTADVMSKNIYWLEKNILSSLHLANNEIVQLYTELEPNSTLLAVVDGISYVKNSDLILREYDLASNDGIFVSRDNVTAAVPVEIAGSDDDLIYEDLEGVNEVSFESEFENFDEKCDCVNGFCVDVKEGLVCVCHEGFKGLRCDESECEGCVHGDCDVEDGKAVCRCKENWFGEKCDSTFQSICAHDPCKENEKRFHDLHSQFRALFFVSVPVITCLTLTTIGLFFLWIRTRHLLQAVNNLPEEKPKRLWSGLIFVPSLLKPHEDKKALLQDQFNLTNTHV